MRVLALSIFVLVGLFQLIANAPYNIENKLYKLDSITSSRLSLSEQSGLLIDPPMELITYFQELNQTCPKLLDSIPTYAKFIADYCTKNPDTYSEVLLCFQDVDSYVATISYVLNARNLIHWPLKQYLLKAFHPHDNYRMLLRDGENRNQLNKKLKLLVDTLVMQSRITLRERDMFFNSYLANNGIDYSKQSLTQEDLIWFSIGDTIVQQTQLSEELLHFNIIHNGALGKYGIYCSHDNNDIHMVVDTSCCSEIKDALYPNVRCLELTDFQLFGFLIGILYDELHRIKIKGGEEMNLIISFPQAFDDNELLRNMFSRNGINVNRITTEKKGKIIEARITSQFFIKATSNKKNIFTTNVDNDVIIIKSE